MTLTLGRPLAAALLLGSLLTVAVAAVAASWADLASASDERDAMADLLARGVAASKRAALTPADAATADPFVEASSETLGAARVDALVRATAVEAGCAVLSSKAEVKPDESGIAGRIEVQSVVEGKNDALQATLLRLETGAPTLLVDALTIEPVEASTALPGDLQEPRLRMQLTLAAYWKPAQP